MSSLPRAFISGLSTLCAMLCIVAVVMSGYASAQERVQILENTVAGDQQLTDGGWVAHCVDKAGKCTGHFTDGEAAVDPIALHHHHHSYGEVSPGIIPLASSDLYSLRSVKASLRPGAVSPLAGLSLSIPHQPPRA